MSEKETKEIGTEEELTTQDEAEETKENDASDAKEETKESRTEDKKTDDEKKEENESEVTEEEEAKEEKQLRSYEKIKPALWERLTTKQKALVIGIPSAVAVVAVILTVVIVRANYYDSLTRGILVYMQDGNMMGVKSFKDAQYTPSRNAFTFLEEGERNDENPGATTTDGKYIYFMEGSDPYHFSLYFAKINGKKKTLVAEGVTDYEIISKGKICYASQGTLYELTVSSGEVRSLCNDALTFSLNSKKDRVVVLGATSLATMKVDDPNTYKVLDTYASRIYGFDEKFETVVYEKNGILCAKYKDEMVREIAGNFSDVSVHNTSGKYQVYYRTPNGDLYFYQRGEDSSVLVKDGVSQLFGAERGAGVFLCATNQNEYYFVEKGTATLVTDNNISYVDPDVLCDEDAGQVYFVAFNNANEGTLYSMSNKLFKKGEMKILESNVVSVEFLEKDDLCICKVAENGTIELYRNGVRMAQNVIPGTVQKTADLKAVVYCVQADGAAAELWLSEGEDFRAIGLSTSADCIPITAKEIYYMGDEEGTTCLMKFNGKKSKSLVENVQEIGYIFY